MFKVYKGKIPHLFRRRKSVHPVVATILIIALTVAAGAIIWTLTQGWLNSSNFQLVIENVGVADKSGNDLGDLLRIVVTNVGSDPAEIRSVTVEVNGTVDPN